MAPDMPSAEVPIDVALVRQLVAAQFPQWSHLPIRPVDGIGWDNAVFRMGEELVVRLPRREVAVGLLVHEHRWLPQVAARLPLPAPVPLARGGPGAGYPWPWSVCPWLVGEMAAIRPPTDLNQAAVDLAELLVALHHEAPPDAPRNPFRGVPLAERDDLTMRSLVAVGGRVAGRARALWREVLDLPAWAGPPVWLHGDLHPGNLLVADGRLSGVIDFGDIGAGDPAVDLLAAWGLLDGPSRGVLQRSADLDEDTWARGRGWALAIGLACLANADDNPVIAGVGRRTLDQVLA